MKIALIGSTGQLGTDIQKVYRQQNKDILIPLTHADIEITKPESITSVLKDIQPDVVITTAAYHKVDDVENNPEKAFLINSIGAKHLADICAEHKQKLVFLSTDYVFGMNNERKKPYEEIDTTGPVNVYGNSKLAGEMFVLSASEKHIVIRTCGLFGTAGASGKGGNFVETMLRLGKEKGKVTVVDDQILTPTYTYNLAQQLFVLLEQDGQGLFHATSEGACSWFSFAQEIFKLTKQQVICEPTNSQSFTTPAKRPLYSVLENRHLKELGINIMNQWQDNLQKYLEEKKYI